MTATVTPARTTRIAPTATGKALLGGVQVVPSILSADMARLGAQIREVLDAGARVIQCDVMDGHFVPPITFGPIVVSAISDLIHSAGGLVDVHLMIERPEQQIEAFAKAGADVITIHYEATLHVHFALGAIHETGCLAGLALNPATPAESVAEVAEMLDLALCMTVNPGWGGQRFIDATLPKIARLREILATNVALQVDGGIDIDTALACVDSGANLLVAGSAVFGAPDPSDAYRRLAAAARSRRRP